MTVEANIRRNLSMNGIILVGADSKDGSRLLTGKISRWTVWTYTQTVPFTMPRFFSLQYSIPLICLLLRYQTPKHFLLNTSFEVSTAIVFQSPKAEHVSPHLFEDDIELLAPQWAFSPMTSNCCVRVKRLPKSCRCVASTGFCLLASLLLMWSSSQAPRCLIIGK